MASLALMNTSGAGRDADTTSDSQSRSDGERHGSTSLYVIEQLLWFGVGLAIIDMVLYKSRVVTTPWFYWATAVGLAAIVATRAALVEWRVVESTLVIRQMLATRHVSTDQIARVTLKRTLFPSSGLQICVVVCRDGTEARVPSTFRLGDRRFQRELNLLSVAVSAPVLLRDPADY
jgi:hypothetical protein